MRQRWKNVDEFCDLYKWENAERVLLSLTASNVEYLDTLQIEDICSMLTGDLKQQKIAFELLQKLREKNGSGKYFITFIFFNCFTPCLENSLKRLPLIKRIQPFPLFFFIK